MAAEGLYNNLAADRSGSGSVSASVSASASASGSSSNGDSGGSGKDSLLPAGWKILESKSHAGSFYLVHEAFEKTFWQSKKHPHGSGWVRLSDGRHEHVSRLMNNISEEKEKGKRSIQAYTGAMKNKTAQTEEKVGVKKADEKECLDASRFRDRDRDRECDRERERERRRERERMRAKERTAGQRIPAQPSHATAASKANNAFRTKVCRNFERGGSCRYGDKCKFAHHQLNTKRIAGQKSDHCYHAKKPSGARNDVDELNDLFARSHISSDEHKEINEQASKASVKTETTPAPLPDSAAAVPDDLGEISDLLARSRISSDPDVDAASRTISMRPYQSQIVIDIFEYWLKHGDDEKGRNNVIVYAPTGAGKTVVGAKIISDALELQPTKKILFVVNRTCIASQTARMLDRFDIKNYSYIQSGKKMNPSASVFIVSIQTFAARWGSKSNAKNGKHKLPQDVDLIIIDEAHGAVAPSYKPLSSAFPSAKILGFTATPFRLSEEKRLSELFHARIDGPSVSELIQDGFLVPTTYIRGRSYFEKAGRRECIEAVRMWMTHCTVGKTKRKTIAFCPSVDCADMLSECFQAAGVKSILVTGKCPPKKRGDIYARFRDGFLSVLCTCDLLTEGFDEPSVSAIILMRKTESRARYVQQVGRGLRPSPGKSDAIVLDLVHSSRYFGRIDDPYLKRKFQVRAAPSLS